MQCQVVVRIVLGDLLPETGIWASALTSTTPSLENEPVVSNMVITCLWTSQWAFLNDERPLYLVLYIQLFVCWQITSLCFYSICLLSLLPAFLVFKLQQCRSSACFRPLATCLCFASASLNNLLQVHAWPAPDSDRFQAGFKLDSNQKLKASMHTCESMSCLAAWNWQKLLSWNWWNDESLLRQKYAHAWVQHVHKTRFEQITSVMSLRVVKSLDKTPFARPPSLSTAPSELAIFAAFLPSFCSRSCSSTCFTSLYSFWNSPTFSGSSPACPSSSIIFTTLGLK